MLGEIRRARSQARAYLRRRADRARPARYVIVRPLPDGEWQVELNTDVLPRLLVNHSYTARVGKGKGKEADWNFILELPSNRELVDKAGLEQRARTILKVSSEIVRRQDTIFGRMV